LARVGQLKTGKMLPGRMSLDFCGETGDIQMVESGFGVNRIKTWIHHALLPLCRLVVLV